MRKYAKAAAEAHSNLNTYHSVIDLLEGGHIYGGRHQTAYRIIALCKRAAGKELQIYDAAMEKLQP